jgi:hypothetical protein
MEARTTTFAIGSLVKARGREWVVLPESEPDLLVLRPLGGSDEEIAGVLLDLEDVEPASFSLPDKDDLGDDHSARLLRDAVRLGFRNAAGPFRSFARIACEPRPYQLVPLLLALKQAYVRLLIADDVGIGKTIEACLIARELLDRGEVNRLAVLCPPHLAEQWQAELRDKFGLEAELVLPGTARRLERRCAANQSLFEVYPHVIVSTDFIKSDRHREDFLRACPELVIVDEAHTCASTPYAGSGRHQRHRLLKGLAASPDRHLVLVTATPHSGKEEAFRSLLALLNPAFANLPGDLSGEQNRPHREALAAHLVQRRRGDIRAYLDSQTPFPDRDEKEASYTLSPDYRKLFDRALAYAQELVEDEGGGRLRQRIRWWSALALLRSIASSPAAAAETLRNRGDLEEAGSEAGIDAVGQRRVLDALDDEATEGADVSPGGDPGGPEDEAQRNRRRLLDMARLADELRGAKDRKLLGAVREVGALVKEGFRPIVFCRFIATAEYVAAELRRALPKDTAIEAVTGSLAPAEREERVLALGKAERRVLVATDCLSEGINLQEHFDAVVHYDLAWNPTRHEQREGRVDRYGQRTPKVRVLTYFGSDNPIDGVVLQVLLRKHQTIRKSLGVSVPVPVDTEQVMQAVLRGALLTKKGQLTLDFMTPEQQDLDREWTSAADRETRSRALFAQHAIRTEDVAGELRAVRDAIGAGVDVERFTREALRAHGAWVGDGDPVQVNLAEARVALRDAIRGQRDKDAFQARFELPVGDDVIHLHRTHPIVAGLAGHVLDTALDPLLRAQAVARRAGAIRTRAVQARTVALLLRLRFHIHTRTSQGERQLLAEDARVVAFRGAPESPEWLSTEETDRLLAARPDANLPPDLAALQLRQVTTSFTPLWAELEKQVRARGEELLEAHRRVRQAARLRGLSQRVEPKLPVDVLGLYLYLPVAS